MEDEELQRASERAAEAQATPVSSSAAVPSTVTVNLERLTAEVDNLKRARRDDAHELQSSDGLVLDLQAKVGNLAVCIDNINERIRTIELATGLGAKAEQVETRKEGQPEEQVQVEDVEEIW